MTHHEHDSLIVRGSQALAGVTNLQGDKSLTHRALIFAALANGTSTIKNPLQAGVADAMTDCLRALGAEFSYSDSTLTVTGCGLRGFHEPSDPLYCRGSATTMRLLAGALVSQAFESTLDGNARLRERPMDRLSGPLREMGARISDRNGCAPLVFSPSELHGAELELAQASAQVKSALLMAGLSANGPLTVVEPHASRDHTERMFRMLGVPIEEWTEPDGAHGVSLSGPIDALPAFDFDLPSDPSSAAFIAGAAAIVPGSLVTIPHVCLNPGRVGFFSVLEDMGAAVMFTKEDERAGEPVGTVRIAYAPLRGTSIGGKTVPAMIDEFPILAVVATQAQGAVRVRDARELRYKESNRIEALARELNKMGAGMEPTEDGFVIKGPVKLKGAKVHAGGDHRLAMSLAVAGFIAEGSTLIEGAHAVDDSFPGFAETFRGLGATIDDHRIDISHGHNREPYGAQP